MKGRGKCDAGAWLPPDWGLNPGAHDFGDGNGAGERTGCLALCNKVLDETQPGRYTVGTMASQPTPPTHPTALGDRALENLSFIRNTMERATAFTGVPGWGGVAMGGTALIATAVAANTTTSREWLGVWLAEGVLAFLIGAWSLGRKSRRLQGSAFTRPARQFLLSFAPPVLAGAVMTAVLWEAGQARLLPGTWLLLYGTGVVTGGAFSVRAVPLMGMLLIGIGAVALFWPVWGLAGMAIGFGGVQVAFGVYIARRHGG